MLLNFSFYILPFTFHLLQFFLFPNTRRTGNSFTYYFCLINISDIFYRFSSNLYAEDQNTYSDYYGNNRDQDEYSRASHRTCCNACYEEREEDIADTSDRITEAGTGQFCRRRPHFRNIHRGSIAYVHIMLLRSMLSLLSAVL